MSEYGLGPWRVEKNRDGHWGMIEVVGPAISCRGFTVATDVTPALARQKEIDARLIAAAPELLDSLGALCNKAQSFVDGECNYGAIEELIVECREVIAMAIGETR